MDEQTQQKFISWLSDQLGVDNEDDLQEQMSQMGDDGIKQAFQVFQKETQAQMNKEGGKVEYLKRLQTGGMLAYNKPSAAGPGPKSTSYTSPGGQVVSDGDLNAYRKQGMDFGTREAMGKWLDTWGSNPKPAPVAQIATPQPKMIKRYNQALRSWETVPVNQVMAEPNSMQVGQPGAWGSFDSSTYKRQVTPQDTVGQTPQVRQNVQAGWDKQGMKFAMGGKISDKGEDSATAKGITNWIKGKDAKSALHGRKDKGTDAKTALKGRMDKGKDAKTAVGVTNWVKGKDAKDALNGRKEK